MTSPDTEVSATRYVLFANGANFSCEVLQALLGRGCAPELLVLPEYPPASNASASNLEVTGGKPERRILALAADIEVGYAPRAWQQDCAELLRRRRIDFLLVACWPYLIDESIVAAVGWAALNLHPSLLPKYRGPNPLEQQLARRDSRFGVSLHLLGRQFDRGDIVAQAELDDANAGLGLNELERQCAKLGVELFSAAITACKRDWRPRPQSN